MSGNPLLRGVSKKETALEIAASHKNKEHILKSPESISADWNILFKLIATGTCDPENIRSDKVSVLCFNLPAMVIIWFYAICSTVGIIIMAGFHFGIDVAFYEVIPWFLGFLLSFTIVIGMLVKLADLLLPFRICLALARIFIILGVLLTGIYLLFAFFGIYLDELITPWPAIGEVEQLKRFRKAVLLVPACIFSYFVIGIVASAATRVSFYFKKIQRG